MFVKRINPKLTYSQRYLWVLLPFLFAACKPVLDNSGAVEDFPGEKVPEEEVVEEVTIVVNSVANHATLDKGAQETVVLGSTLSFMVSADSGYSRINKVVGTCAPGSWSGSTYTTGQLTQDCSIEFFAAPSIYYCDQGSMLWQDPNNWFLDSACSMAANREPQDGDFVYIINQYGGYDSAPPLMLAGFEGGFDGTGTGLVTIASGGIMNVNYGFFSGSTQDNTVEVTCSGTYTTMDGTIRGNATLNGSCGNGGTIEGNAIFNGSSTNGSFWSAGTVKGNAIFNGSSMNYFIEPYSGNYSYAGHVEGNALFNDQSSNLGSGVDGVVDGMITWDAANPNKP